MAKFKVTGLAELNREIERMARDIPKQIDIELKKFADSVLADAVSRVPVDKGLLKASAFVEKIEGGYVIGFSAKYAPYQEFGSGPFTEVPNGFEAYAKEFYVDGSGKTKPQPFLFPPFLQRRESIIQEIEEGIKALINNFNAR